jgi:hypothetical protein
MSPLYQILHLARVAVFTSGSITFRMILALSKTDGRKNHGRFCQSRKQVSIELTLALVCLQEGLLK